VHTYLVTFIADCSVANSAPSRAQRGNLVRCLDTVIVVHKVERVSRMMAVPVILKTWEAEIIVVADQAVDNVVLGENLDTAVAGTSWQLNVILDLLFLGESTWHLNGDLDFRGGYLWLGWDGLRGAVDNLVILNRSLDEPMLFLRTVDTLKHARRAEVIVTILADITMVVFASHSFVAGIAVD
jgi:hypothetical protein